MDNVILLESPTLFKEVITDIVNNLYVSKPSHLSEDVQSAKNELKKLILKNNYNIEAVLTHYETKNWDLAKKEHFISVLKENKTKILLATLQEHNSSFGELVTDFNWLLKLVFGTSELKANKYTVLQLILTLYSYNEERNVIFDINKTILCKLIDVLENYKEIK